MEPRIYSPSRWCLVSGLVFGAPLFLLAGAWMLWNLDLLASHLSGIPHSETRRYAGYFAHAILVIGGWMGFLATLRILRPPVRILADDEGVHLRMSLVSRISIPWHQIARITSGSRLLSTTSRYQARCSSLCLELHPGSLRVPEVYTCAGDDALIGYFGPAQSRPTGGEDVFEVAYSTRLAAGIESAARELEELRKTR